MHSQVGERGCFVTKDLRDRARFELQPLVDDERDARGPEQHEQQGPSRRGLAATSLVSALRGRRHLARQPTAAPCKTANATPPTHSASR